ncbi:CaiB/BaiF CoA transferase family protein [Ottowia thiooxydans]|uniref:CaiB/BaiF CoA transferase family protein n=1 Tax=Ottowia thiooxydans TaxID=219182 RepID=UPI00041125CA|nr:CoA transferase [Ottowia thiooxydans]
MALLRGVRVLSIEQYGAGPFATEYLAALGAEVIKIEQPGEGGDVSRQVGPHFNPKLPETAQSLFFHSLNTGKKSIALDLRSERGRGVFKRLVAKSDAVLNNLRGDVPAKLGITYADLSSANPKIVCAHLSGYGREGPRAKWPGYDYLMQAEAGYFSLTGEPDGPPSRMGLSMIDYMTGVVMSLGLVSGVLNARSSGTGSDVDVSLFDVALHNLNYLAAWYLNAGATTHRQARSAHPSLVPCQLYKTADGWIYLMCNKEKFWLSLCACIGHPEWAKDPRYLDFPARWEHRDELTERLDEVLSVRTTGEWMEIFGGQVPASPVLSMDDALESEYVHDRQRIMTVRSGDGEEVRLVRNPLSSSKSDDEPKQMAPTLGENTGDVLLECGFDPEEIALLRADGVV